MRGVVVPILHPVSWPQMFFRAATLAAPANCTQPLPDTLLPWLPKTQIQAFPSTGHKSEVTFHNLEYYAPFGECLQ